MQLFQLSLTPTQAAFLQTCLPTSYSFQPLPLQFKRPRVAKKIDEAFTADFTLPPHRKYPNPAPSRKLPPQNASISELEPKVEMNSSELEKSKPKQMVNHKQKVKKDSDCSLEGSLGRTLRALKANKSSLFFRNPVNPLTQKLPNSLEVIGQPMDLKTVERKLQQKLYSSFDDFDSDIRKIISNSYQLNAEDTRQHKQTVEFQAFYSRVLNQNFRANQATKASSKRDQKDDLQENKDVTPRKQPKSSKQGKNHSKSPHKGVSAGQVAENEGLRLIVQQKGRMKSLKFRQRQLLFNKINKLSQQGLRNFIKLCGVSKGLQWSQMEIDLGQLSEQTFRKVEVFLNKH